MNNIFAFLKSIFFTIVVALFVSITTYYLTNKNFTISCWMFLTCIILQIVIAYYLSTLIEARNAEMVVQQQKIFLNSSSKRVPITLTCAYCNNLNIVPISFDNEDANNFICKTCNNPNKTLVSFTTARVTTPLVNRIEEKDIIDELEKLQPIQPTPPSNNTENGQ